MKMHLRSRRDSLRAPLLLAIALTTLPMAAALAGPNADPACVSAPDPHPVHACGSSRGGVTLEVDGEQLSVTHHDGDHATTTVVDLDQIGRLVGDAVGEAMVAMEDLQLQVRLGQDNRVDIATADGQFEVDLDQIMKQLAAALQSGLEDIDTATWTASGPGPAASDEDLRLELAELQQEMSALRAELRRMRKPAGGASAAGR